MKRFWITTGIITLLAASLALPCTIISGKTKAGVVWAGNNEDFFFSFNTYLNVLPRQANLLDATQQPRLTGTIYSSVINLTAGDAYNYFAGDFENAYHFNMKELLKKGRQSYLWRSLFPEAPIVRMWETYLSQGSGAAIELFRDIQNTMTRKRKSEVLRHIFSSCILQENKYADAKNFFDEWLEVSGGTDPMTHLYQGLVNLTNGDVGKAKKNFADQIKADAADNLAQKSYLPYAKIFLAKLEGGTPPDSNTRFELKGFHDAKFVCLLGLSYVPVSDLLLKTKDGWAADYALPMGRHHYAFLVDGELVYDPENPVKEETDTVNGKSILNVKVVK